MSERIIMKILCRQAYKIGYNNLYTQKYFFSLILGLFFRLLVKHKVSIQQKCLKSSLMIPLSVSAFNRVSGICFPHNEFFVLRRNLTRNLKHNSAKNIFKSIRTSGDADLLQGMQTG